MEMDDRVERTKVAKTTILLYFSAQNNYFPIGFCLEVVLLSSEMQLIILNGEVTFADA